MNRKTEHEPVLKALENILRGIKQKEALNDFKVGYKKLRAELVTIDKLLSNLAKKYGRGEIIADSVDGVKYSSQSLNVAALDADINNILIESESDLNRGEDRRSVVKRLKEESTLLKRLTAITKKTIKDIIINEAAYITLAKAEAGTGPVLKPVAIASETLEALPPSPSSSSTTPEASEPSAPEPSAAAEAPVTEASDTAVPVTFDAEAADAKVDLSEAEAKSEDRVNSWVKKLGFVKAGGIIAIKPSHEALNAQTIKAFIVLVQEVLSLLNAFKNKGFHEGKENIPVVHDLIEAFLPLAIDGKVVTPAKGDLFNNEWMVNLLILHLYVNSVLIAKTREAGTLSEDEGVDLETLSETLKELLHPSIKSMLTSRGVKITQNLYVAFDTEYQGIGVRQNELLSIQLAGNVGLYLKIPRQYVYRMQYINPSNAAKSFIVVEGDYQNGVKQLIEASIDHAIKTLYHLTHVNYWAAVYRLNDTVSAVEGVVKHDAHREYILYAFPLSPVESLIHYPKAYDLDTLIRDGNGLMQSALAANNTLIQGILRCLNSKKELSGVIDKAFSKRASRFAVYVDAVTRVSVTTERNFYLTCHYTPADLPMLKDFDVFKERLDIVQKCFVTRGKGLKSLSLEDNWFAYLHIRDTWLLAPGGKKSLKEIGKIHSVREDNFSKIHLGEYRTRMKDLLRDNPELFAKYAVQDVLIVLKHVNEMVNTHFNLGRVGIPLTLTAVSTAYILNEWGRLEYNGYQKSPKYLLGNVGKVASPAGLHSLGDLGLYLSYYTASYRGGRNESFMFGEAQGTWVDYDLTSAYTTAMCVLGDPEYHRLKFLQNREAVEALSNKDFFRSYIALEVVYKFPKEAEVKYPCIPENVEEFTTVYSLSGKSVITGFEYLLAKHLGCEFSTVQGVLIPYKLDKEIDMSEEAFDSVESFEDLGTIDDYKAFAPFIEIEKAIQTERRKHPPKTFSNLDWKERGNSGYGLTSQGIGGKRKFDIKTGGTVEMKAGVLSNPLICAAITAFVRCVIAECLNNIKDLQGNVISVTTDGFITDIDDLESKLLQLPIEKTLFLRYFRLMRRLLSNNPQSLEQKHKETSGILSWCTRGQLGLSGEGVKATTGFQSFNYTRESLYKEFSEVLQGKGEMLYIQSSLRSAKSLYESGGHLSMEYKDQSFRLVSDARRQIKPVEGHRIFDSEPWAKAKLCKEIRGVVKLVKSGTYNKYLSKSKGSAYKRPVELGVRAFVRWVLQQGLQDNGFKNYNALVDFVKGCKGCKNVRLSKSSISLLKTQLQYKEIKKNTVPRLPEVMAFFDDVKQRLPHFDGEWLLIRDPARKG